LILALFLDATTHSGCLKRDMDYDIDTIRPYRYNIAHATKKHRVDVSIATQRVTLNHRKKTNEHHQQ